MKKGTIVFSIGILMAFSLSILAEIPQPQWMGVNALVPQAMYWSGVCSYNGKIYVFGGNANDAEIKTTYIYDPVSDTWTQGADMPTGRYLCTAVEVGGKIYVMGGRQLVASTNPVNVNECYDPATDTWTTKAVMPNAIRGHGACAAGGKIYILGGNIGTYTNAVKIYDPAANSWSTGIAMPAIAAYGGAVYSSSTNMIFWIGGEKNPNGTATSFVGKVYGFSLASSSWDAGTAMGHGTSCFGCTANGDGSKIWIVGGTYFDGDAESGFHGAQVFDTASKTFTGTNYYPDPTNRENSNAAFVNGKIYILGGDGNALIDVADPTTGEWYEPNFPLNDGSENVYLTGAVAAGINGKFYVADSGYYAPLTGSVYEYDPPSNMWTKKNAIDPTPRMYVAGGKWNNKIVIYGGMDETNTLLTTATVYDPVADTFTPFANANSDPVLFAAGTVFNNKLYLFGGRPDPMNAQTLTNKISILDLNTRTWSAGPTLPVAIEQATAAAINGKIYIFGGLDNLAPDYINGNVFIYDPATNAVTTGPTMSEKKQSYGCFAMTYGDYIFVDSGYNLWYNATLDGLSGGLLGGIQVFNPADGTFTEIRRPFGKYFHASAMVGDSYYSTTGEDDDYPVARLDIANFSSCRLSCTASVTPISGQAPLTVNFTGNATPTACAGTPLYNWVFGDGATSTQQNPSHCYATEGIFTWRLTVTVDGTISSTSGFITVNSPGIVYQSCGSFSQVTGDGDSYFEKGEKWSVPVALTNTQNTPATNVSAQLSGNGITVCNNPGVFGTIAAGGMATYAFEFLIDPNFQPCGGDVGFDIVNKTCTERTPAGADETDKFLINIGQMVSTGTPADLVIQPSSSDSYISQTFMATNYGTATTMYVQARISQAKRSLVQFDLSGIPPNSRINSATLELYATVGPGTGQTLNVHKVTGSWTETGVTWGLMPAFTSTADASISGGTTIGWKIWNVLPVVQEWVNGTSANYGFMVKCNTETGAQVYSYSFATKEYATTGYRPVLRINYTPPNIWDCGYVGSGTCEPCILPDAPSIAGISDNDPCLQSGISVNYTAGSPATRHDLYKDGSLAASSYTSGTSYNPGDSSLHSYAIRAVNGDDSCSSDSPSINGSDVSNAPTPGITGGSSNSCPSMTVLLTTESGKSGYQWFKDGSPVGGANSYQYSAAIAGSYTVFYIDTNGCSGTSSAHPVTITPCIPNIVYSSRGSFTQITGDGDAWYEKGEKWSIPITLMNTGNTPATNVTAQLSGNDITVCNTNGVFGTIQVGGTATHTFEFLISSTFPTCGGTISFDIVNKSCTELTPAGADEADKFSITVGQHSSALFSETPVNLVIQPSSADSYVNQILATANYGTATTMYAQTRSSQARRSLVQFDLSGIPSNSTINSATLELYATAAATVSQTLNVHRITGAWTEAGVNWNTIPAFTSTADASIAGGNTAGWKIWNVLPVVQEWVNGTSSNYGFMVKCSTETGTQVYAYTFATKENGTAGNRPVLRINYTPPELWNCDYIGTGECSAILDEAAPGDTYENGQMWSEDKNTQSWPALIGAAGYILHRGTFGNLQYLLTGEDDSCLKYQGASTTIDISTDDPSLETDRLYWYLVVGTNGSGDGPAGNTTWGTRIVNSTGNCP